MKDPNRNLKKDMSDEAVARQLKVLRNITPDQRQLLRTTLHKIDHESVTAREKQRFTTQNTAYNSPKNSAKEGWIMNNFRVYVPVGVMALLLVVGGAAFFRHTNNNSIQTANQNSTQPNTANGSVDGATAALNNDVNQEDSINQSVLSEGQAASQDIKTAATQIGDVSNDNSF